MGTISNRFRKSLRHLALFGIAIVVATGLANAFIQVPLANEIGLWPTYMDDIQRTGFTNDVEITKVDADDYHVKWAISPSSTPSTDSIFTQPVVANDQIFFGSFDGYEYSITTSGQIIWKTFLGQTSSTAEGDSPTTGVASTATLTAATIKGRLIDILIVGGGNGVLFALDVRTGDELWSTVVGSSPGSFMWSSPAVFNNHVYVGLASYYDDPLIRGGVVELDTSTGKVLNTFYTVPENCVGGSVWGSPAIDVFAGLVFVATGNPGDCNSPEPYSTAVLALKASDLSLVGSWQVPPSQQVSDSDFGATVTLFTDSSNRRMAGVANKNGVYYAFDRSNISQGPAWQARISEGGECPECGQSAISSSAFDGARLYIAGGLTSIQEQSCQGSVRAVNPADGVFLWETCLNGTGQYPSSVLGSVTVTPELVFVGAGSTVYGLDQSTGKVLIDVNGDRGDGDPLPPYFWGSPSVANGVIYIGNMDGTLYAIGR